MASIQPTKSTSNNPFKGPEDGDPLTSKELLILLSIPRAAQTSPSNTAFRLPLGPDPAQGWIDINFSETCSIVSRLASTWKLRLDALLGKSNNRPSSVGPGTTICILVQPAVNGIFHHLAFGALGCTVQYITLALGDNEICSSLRESKCNFILYSGIDDARVSAMKDRFDGEFVALPEKELSGTLGQEEKLGASIKFEPFPGEGPHKGELAVNTNDIFQEVKDEAGVAYIFLGRGDDMIRIVGTVNPKCADNPHTKSALIVRIVGKIRMLDADVHLQVMWHRIIRTFEVHRAINARWKEGVGCGWMLDAVQLFGNTLPHTALVVQVYPTSQGRETLGKEVLDDLYDAVKRVSEKLAPEPLRVDPRKRMLVMTSEGEAYGPNAESVQGLRLQVTHKHSLQRWQNVQAFKPWLDGLGDGDEPGMTAP